MSKHTPGPWYISYEKYWVIEDNKGDIVARSFGNKELVEKANARLIAAAPELLEACLMMVSDSFSLSEAMEAIHSAIAKAKGERGE